MSRYTSHTSGILLSKRDADQFYRAAYFSRNVRIPEWVCTCMYLNRVNRHYCGRCDRERA